MSQKHATIAKMVSCDWLRIPELYTTPPRKVDDDLLLNSVKLTGIQQPLVVVQISERDYLVIDGVRRLNVARSIGLDVVPCVIDTGIDDVDDEVQYRNRIRFILDEHRQDLLPSQRAALIRKLQQMFGMQAKQVALYLGVTSGTITNWTLIDKMIPEIRRAIDSGELTVHTARAFAGITADGQRELWTKHRDEVLSMTGSRLHRWLRDTYPPTEFRTMYGSPDNVLKQLARKSHNRKSRKRTKVSTGEKKSLLRDVDAKRIELEDKQSQIADMQQHIEAAIGVILQIRAANDFWASLPAAVRDDFEEFAERLIPDSDALQTAESHEAVAI